MPHFRNGYTVAGPVSQESIDRFGEFVPLELERAWKEEGQLVTADGFARAIDPAALLPVMDTILPALPGAVPLFATAWGDLIVYHDDELYFVYYRIGIYRDVADPWSGLIFDELEDEAMQRDFFVRDFYDQAVSALGVPAIDECFGFVLPLSLGGAPDVSNVARRPLKEHLVFLVQSGGPPRDLDEVAPPRDPQPVSAQAGSAGTAPAGSPDAPTSQPTSAQSGLIERGKQLLDKVNPDAAHEFQPIPDDRAVYVWQDGFGGSQILVGEDGSVLYGNSSLDLEAMLGAWRSGRRTQIDQFERPV